MRFRFLLLLCFALPVLGQVPCGAPPAKLTLTQPNIFSEQQEQWLGEAMADQLDAFDRPVKNAELNAYLETIGKRLLAALPPTTLKFHYTLVESSEVNGFSLAGGRVYLTRKLVASVHSEDEIAGVIAHEMGHILTHQFAIATTADLKRLLNITSVGDRADIYAKYQRLIDARLHDKHPGNPDDDDKQDQADRVAVYAAASAGYRPQAYAEFWDRTFFIGGKTGNRFGDLFYTTKPDAKRLRKIRGIIAELPPACATQTQAAASPAFQKWQHAVLENQVEQKVDPVAASGSAGTDLALKPTLRLDIERLRFSRDGKYILAQDASSIHVLTREPFKELFRFAAENALPAEFTPDSQQIDFVTNTLHVEVWGIAAQKLVSVHEVVVLGNCLQVLLSPDARSLGCVSQPESRGSVELALYDVATGAVVFKTKDWFDPSQGLVLSFELRQNMLNMTGLLTTSFSADGNTLLIGPGSAKLALDLRTRTRIKLAGALTDFLYDSTYCFYGNDQVIAINQRFPDQSGIFTFPEGKRLQKFALRLPYMLPTTGGKLIISAGPRDLPLALVDPPAGKYVITSRGHSLDLFGDSFLSENVDGSIALAKLTGEMKGNFMATLSLSPLPSGYAISMSPDAHYLAFSGRLRGTIWDLESGKQVAMVRGFRAGTWQPDGKFLGYFPARDKDPAVIREVTIAPASVRDMLFKVPEKAAMEDGQLVEWKQDKKIWSFYVTSPVDGTARWSRTFGEHPPAYTTSVGDETEFTFSYRTDSALGRDKLRAAPELKDAVAAVKEKANGRLIEIVNAADGKTVAQTVIEVPRTYTTVDQLNRVGDRLYLSTVDNRTVVYSMETGAQLRQVFGSLVTADAGSGVICTNNRRDEVAVLDKDGVELLHLNLGTTVRFAALQDKGTRLILVTADQHIHRFDVPARKP